MYKPVPPDKRPRARRKARSLLAFDLVHPVVQLGCFAVILIFTMMAIHPVFLMISYLAALSFSFYAQGWRSTLKGLAWQIPLILICTAINPLFSAVGSTQLFRIGSRAIYAESVIYGACMGLMLASIILWFSNAVRVLTLDKVMTALGNRLPTIGIMLSMTMRMVPQFVTRGRLIGSTMQAVSSAKPQNAAEQTGGRIRLVSVLMGWSMEDSLETADSMRARAWGATHKRTSYQRYRFCTYDAVASAGIAALVVIDAILAIGACLHFQFYPTMTHLTVWWGYLPYALLLTLPLLACLIDDLKWRRISKTP